MDKVRVAIISDVHGNVEALKAVLKDAANEHAEKYITVGDIALKGPGTDICLELLEKLNPLSFVLGNHEQVYRDFLEGKSFNYSIKRRMIEELVKYDYAFLGDEKFRYLATLPKKVSIQILETKIDVFHAMPKSASFPIYATEEQAYFEEMFSDTDADVAINGHVHRQSLRRTVDDKLIINSGSVGLPGGESRKTKDNLAQYALIDIAATGVVDIHFKKIAYDIDAEIAFAKKRALPYVDIYEKTLRSGQYLYIDSQIEQYLD
ncbi:metallophosphoesterase family protein [Listeria sp. FSL L7-1485]|uniref:Metallophosphoesterase family protein n=1 Tax=Listeria immobilis TaxID=2713502 RepID=A0A7X1C7Y5_9LIST|nr:metallophosphoesterase family protein [Listeria immobilis]MBC1484194.1 metallophosphoesterase family protein [Listeria immobilis]MBC1487713.1 metallophosphoesterase family protein [Listeria immobilis]MBC1516203.1 metallophosphoesterase family protein [Listeria immobilis]MBC1534528.1 metallophosphoesterase family protein [Listeria immobilis]MBC6304467.1 metallophosphoesterase family protein [Listeria immobilis]